MHLSERRLERRRWFKKDIIVEQLNEVRTMDLEGKSKCKGC